MGRYGAVEMDTRTVGGAVTAAVTFLNAREQARWVRQCSHPDRYRRKARLTMVEWLQGKLRASGGKPVFLPDGWDRARPAASRGSRRFSPRRFTSRRF